MQVRRTTAAPVRRVIRDEPFIEEQPLFGMVFRMITMNSLGAFAQEIARRPAPVEGVRSATPSAPSASVSEAPSPLRPLEAVPPQPGRPLPRGSLLDLRL